MTPSTALAVRTIVFPTDGTAVADHALDQAAFYADLFDAVLHVVSVHTYIGDAVVSTVIHHSRPARLDPPSALGYIEASVEALTPEQGILDYAAKVDADLIVMATHGRRGLAHWLDGSVAEGVARQATCPVLTMSPSVASASARAARILVATDFSDTAYLACAHAVALARRHGAAIDLLHVVEAQIEPGLPGTVIGWGPGTTRRFEDARKALGEFVADLDATDLTITYHVVTDAPAHGILDAAERLGADLIVAGSHGRTGLRRLVLGSVAETLVQRAPCPVMIVKASGKSLLRTPETISTAAAAPRA